MARLLTTNMASTILGGSLGGTSGDTTISLGAGTGALFPTLPQVGDYFHGALKNSSGQVEIVKVTARSTDSLTVVRGQEGTTIRSFSAGDLFELRLTAADIEFIQSSYWSREGAVVACVNNTQFTVVGDQTARYVQYRAVHAIQTSSAYGYVVSSSYSSGTGLTTVVVEALTVDAGLAAIEYGQDPTSAPKYGALTGEVLVSSDDTTFGYLEGKLALASNSGLVLAVTSPAGNEVLTIKADLGVTVQPYDADTMKSDAVTARTRAHRFTPVAVTAAAGGALAIDLDLHEECTITLAETTTTVGSPSNHAAGNYFVIQITGTTGKALAWNTNWKKDGSACIIAAPANGVVDLHCFRSSGTEMIHIGSKLAV